jgi:hypothetical protein
MMALLLLQLLSQSVTYGADGSLLVRRPPPACRYKEQDGTNANVSHGFKTMFAHFKEFDKKTILKKTRDEVHHEHADTCVSATARRCAPDPLEQARCV